MKIMKSLANGDTPIRITEIRYIKNKHHELSNKYVKNNPKIKSLSRCELCHTKANTGSYSKREINIPGFGCWED